MLCCDVCGKTISPPRGQFLLQGAKIVFAADDDVTQEGVEWMQYQLGPFELGRVYRLCVECLLRSYGLKPEEECQDTS
jgi:hypothetical protein